MLGFDDALRLHQQALKWSGGLANLQIPEKELEDLERRKAATVLAAQGRLQDGTLRNLHLQTLVELVSHITHEQRNLLDRYGHEVWAHYTNIPLVHGIKPATITREQQTTVKFDSQTGQEGKRKAPDVRGPEPGKRRKPNLPGKKQAASSPSSSDGKCLPNELGSNGLGTPKPQPGVPYQVLCRKFRYVPAVVLFPGCSEGPFSVKNTELLRVEECCHYDQQTNTLSCRDAPGICYPVQYFDVENPAERDVAWIQAASLEPLDPGVVSQVDYERISKYMQKYGQCANGPRVCGSPVASPLVARNDKRIDPSTPGIWKNPGSTSTRETDARMAIARFV